jgi:predicted nuclease of predicted toxin-antitoxin system
VRLLLDANLSARRVGGPLEEAGHDVRGVGGDADLEGLADSLVLELATRECRVLVTRNSRDFAPIARQWAEAGREHAGIILIWTLSHRQFGEIVAGVERWAADIPSEEAWRGLVVSL